MMATSAPHRRRGGIGSAWCGRAGVPDPGVAGRPGRSGGRAPGGV